MGSTLQQNTCMKKLSVIFTCLSFFCISHTATAQGILTKVKEKTKQRADNKVDNAIDKGLDKVEESAKEKKDNSENTPPVTREQNNSGDNSTRTNGNDTPSVAPATLKVYQNYDFVPGEKVLFEDNFNEDQDGEFPAHWELKAGQAVVNKVKGEPAFFLTDGNYARVKPRMKTTTYLTDPFTIEFDSYFVPGTYGPMAMFMHFDQAAGYEKESYVHLNRSEINYSGNEGVSFSKNLPEEIAGDAFDNAWHHIAIAYKNKQLKIYVDQYRVLVVPDTKETFDRLEITGIGDEKSPIIVKNLRIAAGGNMNMLGKKFTESKIVTHGINFDIDKATIRPESMGTLNMIVQVMKDNPEIRFQVQGHTDNTGSAAHNLTLSQQRADAVREQLVKMGIDASRLTAKGFGDTIPVGDNTTIEGKANNRRVEFVKM